MPRASQPTSPQPHPAALSTPQIGNGAAGVSGWQNWAAAGAELNATISANANRSGGKQPLQSIVSGSIMIRLRFSAIWSALLSSAWPRSPDSA